MGCILIDGTHEGQCAINPDACFGAGGAAGLAAGVDGDGVSGGDRGTAVQVNTAVGGAIDNAYGQATFLAGGL